jgi:hypothetical protein
MKGKLLAGLILAGSSLFAGPRIAVGIGIGAPAPAVAYVPPCPGPDYVFLNGYWQLRRPVLDRHEVIVHRDAFHRDFRHDGRWR